ncbi:Uncharacterised protein [Yersinia frederiksenii]|nr:Uncharacterised protein [Yersinia frederiksenii]
MKIDIALLQSAAKKYIKTFEHHTANPLSAEALHAWDAADAELSAVINNDETNIIISLLERAEAAEKRAEEMTEQYLDRNTALTFVTLRAEASEARLLVPDEWNVLGPTYPDHYTPVLVAMNGVVQHITYQIEEGDNGDYWQPVGNDDADGAPITQFQHWKPLPAGFKVEGELDEHL